MPEPAIPANSADGQLAQRWLDYVRHEKRLAERTSTLYAQSLRALLEWLAARGLSLAQMRDEHVRAWVRTAHSGGASARTIALTLSAWRGFFAWLGRQKLAPRNPVASVRAPLLHIYLPYQMDQLHYLVI